MTPRPIQTALVATAIVLSSTIVIAHQFSGFRQVPPPEWESAEDMQDFYIRRFESAIGFGLSRMPTPPMLTIGGISGVWRRHEGRYQPGPAPAQ
jgi:hypothetical protein